MGNSEGGEPVGGAKEENQPIRGKLPATTCLMRSHCHVEDQLLLLHISYRNLAAARLSCRFSWKVAVSMLLAVLSWFCSSLLLSVSGGKLPEAEVQIDVLYRPFLCHRKSKYGDILLVHHEGYFENGTLFHSSRNEGDKQPMWFTLGIKEVIKGWDKGLQDMCAGEKRKLVIPPALAYGKEGKGKIPPESTLTFIIEVLEIRNGPRSHESFQEMDLNDDWRLSKQEVKEYLRKEFERHGYPPNDTLHENMVADIFAKEDKNKDGFISSREFTYKHDEL